MAAVAAKFSTVVGSRPGLKNSSAVIPAGSATDCVKSILPVIVSTAATNVFGGTRPVAVSSTTAPG